MLLTRRLGVIRPVHYGIRDLPSGVAVVEKNVTDEGQTPMTDIVRGADFREVDAAANPQALVATLDAVAAREGIRRLKRRGLKLLAVTTGNGCSTLAAAPATTSKP